MDFDTNDYFKVKLFLILVGAPFITFSFLAKLVEYIWLQYKLIFYQ